jgi:hypothetical protein
MTKSKEEEEDIAVEEARKRGEMAGARRGKRGEGGEKEAGAEERGE